MLRKIVIAVAVLLTASVASANYVGSEVQYFNPTPDNLDFFTVHSSRTLPKGTIKTTLFFDYAENIHYSPALENKVLQAQLGFAMGLTDSLSFSISGQGILNYDEEVGPAYTSDNFTYVRTGIKYSFCECEKGGFAIIGNLGFGLMNPDYFTGNDNDLGASIVLAWDRLITEKVRFAANLGYRYRNSGDPEASIASAPQYAGIMGPALAVGDTRNGSDVLASVAVNFLINQKLTGVAELYTTLPVDQFFDFTVDDDSYDQKGAEVLLGANYNLTDRMDIGMGGTVGVFSQAQNADWRVFAGMGYAFGSAPEDAAFNLGGNTSAPKPEKVAKKEEKKEETKPAEEVNIEDAPTIKEFNVTAKFPSGSATLTDEAKSQLKKAGDFLKENKNYRMVFIEGHTDAQGAEDFNKLLSERRARMVKVFMTREYGIPAEKIQSVGFGETAPIADNSSAAGRAKNRRVTIKIK